jgi:hypothetical protein
MTIAVYRRQDRAESTEVQNSRALPHGGSCSASPSSRDVLVRTAPADLRCYQTQGQSPRHRHLHERTGSQGPSLHRHDPASSVPRPCPTPVAAAAQSRRRGRYPRCDGSPPFTRNTFPTCRSQYPGGPRRVRLSVSSPSHMVFPDLWAGRRPRLHIRGLLRLHSRYGPLDWSAACAATLRRVAVSGRSILPDVRI